MEIKFIFINYLKMTNFNLKNYFAQNYYVGVYLKNV